MKYNYKKFIVILGTPIFYFSRALRKLDNKLTLFFLKGLSRLSPREDKGHGSSRLIFILENIGDTICASPVLNLISVDDWVVCTRYNCPVIDMFGHKNVLVLNRDPGMLDLLRIIRRLGKMSFSASIVLDYTPSGDFGVLTSRILNTGRILSGFSTGVSGDVHTTELMADSEGLDMFSLAKASIASEVFFKDNEMPKKQIKIICGAESEVYRDFIGIHIGGFGSVNFPVSRQYPEDFTFELIRILLSKGCKVLATGDRGDMKRFRKFRTLLEDEKGFIDFSGNLDLRQLAGVLKGLRCYITPDNGTLHLAQAVGCKKVFALLGPTDPAIVRGRNTEIIRIDLPCSPCIGFLKMPSRCVNSEDGACMRLMPPQVILDRVVPYLEKDAGGA